MEKIILFLAFMCGKPAAGSSVTANSLFKSVDPWYIHFTTSPWRRFLVLSPLILCRQSMEYICLYHVCRPHPHWRQIVMRDSHFTVLGMSESVVWVGRKFAAWRNLRSLSEISVSLQYDDILVRSDIPDSKIVRWRALIEGADQNNSREPYRRSPPLFTIGNVTNSANTTYLRKGEWSSSLWILWYLYLQAKMW